MKNPRRATQDLTNASPSSPEEASTPDIKSLAVSTVKKSAPASKSSRLPETGRAIEFGSPDVSTPPAPSLNASSHKIACHSNMDTPVESATAQERCTPSTASSGTPATPPDINCSLSFNLSNRKVIKEFARALSTSSAKAPPSDVSSLASPALPDTPPVPPLSSVKKPPKKAVLGSPPTTPLIKQVPSGDSTSVGSTPPVPKMSSTKKPRKVMSPPVTPLLASASKKTLSRRERRGVQEEESPSTTRKIFEGKMDEDDDDEPVEDVKPKVIIERISENAYQAAPKLVRMQASLQGLNNLIAEVNGYFNENSCSSITEEAIVKLAEKRMLVMGLVHFGKLVMQKGEGSKKIYSTSK